MNLYIIYYPNMSAEETVAIVAHAKQPTDAQAFKHIRQNYNDVVDPEEIEVYPLDRADTLDGSSAQIGVIS